MSAVYGSNNNNNNNNGQSAPAGKYFAPDLIKIPCDETGLCISSCICCCCRIYDHRAFFMQGDWPNNYRCCGGICLPNKKWGGCAQLCFLCECICCTGMAASGNRYLIQQSYGYSNSDCDQKTLCCNNICQICVCVGPCLCRCLAAVTGCGPIRECSRMIDANRQLIRFLGDVLFCCILSCMNAQHQKTLLAEGATFGGAPQAVPGMNNNAYNQPQGKY